MQYLAGHTKYENGGAEKRRRFSLGTGFDSDR